MYCSTFHIAIIAFFNKNVDLCTAYHSNNSCQGIKCSHEQIVPVVATFFCPPVPTSQPSAGKVITTHFPRVCRRRQMTLARGGIP